MEAINSYPYHGFDTWLLVSYFYDGMSSSMKQLLETMCGGDFMKVGRMKSQPNAPNAKAGMYNLNEDIDMKTKVAAIARRYTKCIPFLKHQCKLCRVPFVNLLSTWWRNVL
ncbi:hypothetical protein CK203_108486 [Vitis vinifera]|uniref:Uncharacterized protein n=1 Tax=Vitis vinifera TaxID=29760 RepID=A0A438C583_VITVI|nr:hypothetical protein CK203_108486 [Vitis vinifera]